MLPKKREQVSPGAKSALPKQIELLENMKTHQKNLKKNGQKHTQFSNPRVKFGQKIPIFLLCAKKTNF